MTNKTHFTLYSKLSFSNDIHNLQGMQEEVVLFDLK